MAIERSDDAPTLDIGEATPLVDEPCETAEGPLWHEDERVLYWLDIPTGRLFRCDPRSKTNEVAFQHDAPIGGYTIQADGSLLLFCGAGAILHWRDGAAATVIDDIDREKDGRFNDVIADPAGRVYCGTMPTADGLSRLYRLDLDGSLTMLFDDIGLSNGMGFTADHETMFHTDTGFRTIYRLDYDEASGEVSNRAPLVRTPKDGGAPDGMCVDTTDTLWSARSGGGGIFRYTAQGELTGFAPMPARKVTSLTLGGENYGTAFVTTAGGNERGDENGALAGSLFSIDLGVQGKATFRSRISV